MLVAKRPNRLRDVKDETYHAEYAKYCIGSYERSFHYNLVNKYIINSAFYKGEQWIFDEDLDAFFMDESGDVRNRIKIVHNIVKPYVEYLRGSVVRMDINFKIDSISREAKVRRDNALRKLMLLHKTMTETSVETASFLKNKYSLGDSENETVDSFNNLYIDTYAKRMKDFVKFVAEYENDFEALKNELAENLALSGLGILKEDDRNGKQLFETVKPTNFGFDLSARKRDLSDSQFFFDFDLVSPVDILEEFPNIDPYERQLIESITVSGVPSFHNVSDFYFGYDINKAPKYNVYWQDVEIRRHAAVLDKFGNAILADMEEGKYTDKDIIPKSKLKNYIEENRWIETVLQNKPERDIPVDSVRFAKIIPAQYTNNLVEDIILDYGIRPYSSLYSFGRKKLNFPYICFSYAYIEGEIISPVDALISPQRYLNRVLSVAESHINNSRGSGMIIDGDTITDGDGIEGVQRNMNQSKPVVLYAQKQLNNAVVPYDSTVKSGTLTMFNIANQIKAMADDTTGGSAIKGEGGAYRVSVGALEQNLNQGTVLQESYFYALTKIIFRGYDAILNRGKRIYISNGRTISIIVGDDEYISFKLTKDYEAEEFKLKVERAASAREQSEYANNMLMLLLDKKLIDGKIFAKYYGNAGIQEIGMAIREYQSILEEQIKIMQKQREQANEQASVQAAGQMALQNLEDEKNDTIALEAKNKENMIDFVKSFSKGK